MNTQIQLQHQNSVPPMPVPMRGVLQRACACGQHSDGGECESCRKKREGTLQRAATNSPPTSEVPPIVQEVLNSPGQAMDASTRAFMEPRFGHDFSHVRVHTDAKAVQSARAVNALAYTVGDNVAFGSGEYAPHTDAGQKLLAHELTHVVQQRAASGSKGRENPDIFDSPSHEAEAATASAIVTDEPAQASRTAIPLISSLSRHTLALQRQPTDLGAYPENERRALVQSTVPTTMIDAAFLLTVFGTAAQNGGVATSYPTTAQVVFDPTIPAALQRGLSSTGAYLAGQTNVLPAHATVTLTLDLTPFKGPNARFRFSRIAHVTGKTTTEILLIENVGAAPAAIAPVTVPTGNFTVGGQTFTAGPGWDDAKFGRLQAALGRLPAAVLTEAAGTTFSLRGQGTTSEAGHYDAAHDEIEMHANAFPVSATTYGGADEGMRAITHEIGHLLDLRRLERAWQTFNTGGQTKAGKKTLLDTRSLSGSRWQADAKGNFSQIDARTVAKGNDFRQAAQKDGVRPGKKDADPLTGGPTSYSDTDWQELFAESFSLYVNDPTLFRLIRPNLFQYFNQRFPLPTAQPAAGQGTNVQPAPTP